MGQSLRRKTNGWGRTKEPAGSLMINRQSLKDFLQDAEAPEGYGYLWNGDLVAQIHFFDKEYTLFWLGTVEGRDLSDIFLQLVNNHVSILINRGAKKNRDCWFRVRSFYECEIDGQRKFRPAELHLTQIPPDASALIGPVRNFIDWYIGKTTAYYFFADFASKPQWRTTLWGDSPLSASTYKEVGLTSNLPIDASLVQNLFRKTSIISQHIPSDELNRFFRGEVFQQSSRYWK